MTKPHKPHSERAHSKFSASGAERWFNCPGSVKLSEGQPDKSSPWAEEGTRAHEYLERSLKAQLQANQTLKPVRVEPGNATEEMKSHGENAAQFIMRLHYKLPESEVLVESKVYLDFIHKEMFGTYDGAVVDHFGTLHVFDYKYGAGHAVTPKNNLQMIFYGIGLAHKFNWNFKKVRLWIIQPRIRGYDGPLFWEIPIKELRAQVKYFKMAVKQVEEEPDALFEGEWCWFCKAKTICPLKKEKRLQEARSVFTKIKE